MATKIVKVQLPLLGDADRMLVYAEGGERLRETSVDQRVVEKLRGDKKGFFLATWSDQAGWRIGDRTRDQSW